jgi:hypothetical protein
MAQSFSRYVIRCLDQDASGSRPYWCGRIKNWVPEQAFASIYKQSHRDQIDRDGTMPARGGWERIGLTEQDFVNRFKIILMHKIRKNPFDYLIQLDEVDSHTRQIVANLKSGNGEVWPIAKQVASEFGIPGKSEALQAFLNTPPAS